MGRSISTKQTEQIYTLKNQGHSYVSISNIVGVSPATARRQYIKEKSRIESGGLTKEELAKAMVADRMTMYMDQVAKKYGYSERHVMYITNQSPLKDQFLRRPLTNRKPNNDEKANEMAKDRTVMDIYQVATKYGVTPRTVVNLTRYHALKDNFKKPKKVKKPKIKPDKSEIRQELSTGQLKKNAIDRILPKREFDPAKQRHVHIPEKKLTISVSADDPRTNDEIRTAFLQRAEEDMESCKIRDQRKHTRNFKTKSRGISEVSVRGIF